MFNNLWSRILAAALCGALAYGSCLLHTAPNRTPDNLPIHPGPIAASNVNPAAALALRDATQHGLIPSANTIIVITPAGRPARTTAALHAAITRQGGAATVSKSYGEHKNRHHHHAVITAVIPQGMTTRLDRLAQADAQGQAEWFRRETARTSPAQPPQPADLVHQTVRVNDAKTTIGPLKVYSSYGSIAAGLVIIIATFCGLFAAAAAALYRPQRTR